MKIITKYNIGDKFFNNFGEKIKIIEIRILCHKIRKPTKKDSWNMITKQTIFYNFKNCDRPFVGDNGDLIEEDRFLIFFTKTSEEAEKLTKNYFADLENERDYEWH